MKKYIQQTNKALLTAATVLASVIVYAGTFTTMADGDWNDPSIWSVDGGQTSCECIPSNPTEGSDIVIKHELSFNNNLVISGGSKVTVKAYEGKLLWGGAGGGSVNVVDGQFYVNNTVDLNQLEIGIGGNVTIVGYSEFYIHNTIVVYGQLYVSGGYLIVDTGNLTFEATADVQLTNFSKIDVTNGNLENHGSLFISGTSCLETYGTWQNGSQGTVSGEGFALSVNGVFQNFGSWEATVGWCGNGNPKGMPAESCTEVSNGCGMLVLGVTFCEFEANKIGQQVNINWTTVSERSNDHFIIERSKDADYFETIGFVDGSGTTSSQVRYAFTDIAPMSGINYYRLRQVDNSGDVNYSPVKAVAFEQEEAQVVKTVNLMGQEVDASYSGVVLDILSDGTSVKRFQVIR